MYTCGPVGDSFSWKHTTNLFLSCKVSSASSRSVLAGLPEPQDASLHHGVTDLMMAGPSCNASCQQEQAAWSGASQYLVGRERAPERWLQHLRSDDGWLPYSMDASGGRLLPGNLSAPSSGLARLLACLCLQQDHKLNGPSIWHRAILMVRQHLHASCSQLQKGQGK